MRSVPNRNPRRLLPSNEGSGGAFFKSPFRLAKAEYQRAEIFMSTSRHYVSRARTFGVVVALLAGIALTGVQPVGAVRANAVVAPTLGTATVTVPMQSMQFSDTTLGPDGNLWATGWEQTNNGQLKRIWRITPTGVVTTFNASACTTSSSITSGSDGNLWFICSTNSVAKITPSGTISTVTVTVGEYVWGSSIDTGSDGNLWIVPAAMNNRKTTRLTTAGVATIFQVRGGATAGTSTKGSDGNLWFGNGSSVSWISPAGQSANITAGRLISGAFSIVAGNDKNIWIGNNDNSITRLTPSGEATNFFGGSINNPRSLTLGPDGNIWFLNTGNSSIGRITPTGQITNFVNDQIDPFTIEAITPEGFLWIRSGTDLLKIALAIPSAPRNITASPENGQATISWTSPISNGGFSISGYTVTASPGGKTCTTSGALSCTVTGLTNGTAYTFKVRAATANGAGLLSAAATATPRAVTAARSR